MGNIPVLKPNEVIAILIKLGFTEVRQRGSHKQFRNMAGRCTTVPFHQGRDISPILLRQIAKDIGLALDEFLKHRYPHRNEALGRASTPEEIDFLKTPGSSF